MSSITQTIAAPSFVTRRFATRPQATAARGRMAGVANAVRSSLQAASDWLQRARGLDQLAHLDDRMLRDIGVDPTMVPARQHGNPLPLLMAALSH